MLHLWNMVFKPVPRLSNRRSLSSLGGWTGSPRLKGKCTQSGTFALFYKVLHDEELYA